MENTITISLEDVSNSSTKIKNCSTKLTTIINDLTKIVNEINTGWSSSASETFVQRFKSFVDKFDDCKASIDNYANFLDQTVEAYRKVDSTIDNAAQQ